MIASLKSEIRKLLTVRSTYILVIIALFLTTLFTFLSTSPVSTQEQVSGKIIEQRNPDGSVKSFPDPKDPPVYVTHVERNLPKEKLLTNLQGHLPILSLFVTVVVVLFMAHEFRYNTIAYTLTTARRRSTVLLSKLIVSTTFVAVITLLGIGLIVMTTYAAVGLKGLTLPAQDYNWWYVLGRLMGYSLGYSLAALAIIALVRNLTAGVAAIFVLPTINAIGAELLASRHIEATRILPYTALDRVSNLMGDYPPQNAPHDFLTDPSRLPASALGAATVFGIYLVIIWAVAWILFVRRDAN